MFRKSLLFCAAVAAMFALTMSTSVAQGVHVENDGHHELESEVDWAFVADVGGVHVPQIQCQTHWEMDVSETGHMLIFAEGLEEHEGSTGPCGTMEPCNGHAPWEGQIFEGFTEPGTSGTHEFGLDFTFCLENSGALSGIPFAITCEINDLEIHCDDNLQGAPPLEVEGEIRLHESLGLMHAEAL